MSKVCFTALFSNYEELKEPSVYTEGWLYYCFTDQPITSNTWRIIPTDPNSLNKDRSPNWSPRHAARFVKTAHPAIGTWDQSFWVDASFKIDINLNDWWRQYMVGYLSAPKHPLRDDCDEEILACILSNRCNLETLAKQREAYRHIPRHEGVIQSGLLMRTPEAVPLCDAWWEELCKWSTRDQVAFCEVSRRFAHHSYQFDYRREKDFIYSKHFKDR